MPLEKQVTILFAGTKGYLDALPVASLGEYEQQLYAHIEANEPAVFDQLREKEEIDSGLEELLNKTLTAFGETFKGSQGLN